LKYFILGSFASGLLLLGMSFIYFGCGSLNFEDISLFLYKLPTQAYSTQRLPIFDINVNHIPSLTEFFDKYNNVKEMPFIVDSSTIKVVSIKNFKLTSDLYTRMATMLFKGYEYDPRVQAIYIPKEWSKDIYSCTHKTIGVLVDKIPPEWALNIYNTKQPHYPKPSFMPQELFDLHKLSMHNFLVNYLPDDMYKIKNPRMPYIEGLMYDDKDHTKPIMLFVSKQNYSLSIMDKWAREAVKSIPRSLDPILNELYKFSRFECY
jgi:hypothetical protein